MLGARWGRGEVSLLWRGGRVDRFEPGAFRCMLELFDVDDGSAWNCYKLVYNERHLLLE